MGKSCKEIAETLAECLNQSNCVKSGGNPKSCMNTVDEATGEKPCLELRTSYYLCKRGTLDMRTRIRGPKAY